MTTEKPQDSAAPTSAASALSAGLGATSTKKPNITPAMREWLRRLANPRRCEWVKYKPEQLHVYGRGTGSLGSPSYVMAEKLLDAGLIHYAPREVDGGSTEYIAVLTREGLSHVAPNVD